VKPHVPLTPGKLKARKAARKRKLEKSLEDLVSQLKALGALRIIAFGSYATGTIRSWSDLDVIVVMPSARSGKEWFRVVHDSIDVAAPADVLPFTEEELKSKLKTSSFIRHAMRTGKVVYEKG
jgi:predicted nucleotidyltransferase